MCDEKNDFTLKNKKCDSYKKKCWRSPTFAQPKNEEKKINGENKKKE